MKKYKLIKDIPTHNGTIKAGTLLIPLIEIQAVTPQRPLYRPEGTEHEIAPEFIENNPEFFEEITRWKPEENEEFYHFVSCGNIELSNWDCDEPFDEMRYGFGNCFKTKNQAEEARIEIAKLLFKFHENL